MSDLTDIQAAQSVKIIGSDATGVETNTLAVDSSHNMQTVNNNGAGASAVNIQDGGNSITVDATSLPLPTGAATEAKQDTQITSLQLIDDIPHSQNAAFSKGVPAMGQMDDTSTTSATEDNVAAMRITPLRALHVNFRNASGTEIGTSGNPVRIDPTGTTSQPVKDVIAVAGQNRAQSVTTSAAEALGAATILANRKFIAITPTNGTVYWGFANTVTTSNGTPIFKNQTCVIAATDNVHIYVIAGSTVDTRMAEGS